MSHRVTLIPGDGIGPEITKAATAILEATGVAFDWVEIEAGIRAYEKTGNPLPQTPSKRTKLPSKVHSRLSSGKASRVPPSRSVKVWTSTPI